MVEVEVRPWWRPHQRRLSQTITTNPTSTICRLYARLLETVISFLGMLSLARVLFSLTDAKPNRSRRFCSEYSLAPVDLNPTVADTCGPADLKLALILPAFRSDALELGDIWRQHVSF